MIRMSLRSWQDDPLYLENARIQALCTLLCLSPPELRRQSQQPVFRKLKSEPVYVVVGVFNVTDPDWRIQQMKFKEAFI